MENITDESIYELLLSKNVDDVKLGILIALMNRPEPWFKDMPNLSDRKITKYDKSGNYFYHNLELEHSFYSYNESNYVITIGIWRIFFDKIKK